jgi:hypothetical protein
MRMADGSGFDDEVRLRWDADMMCSAGQAVCAAVWPARWEHWLLFNDAAFALVLRGLAGAAGGDLARLHEFANVPGTC